MFWSKHQREDQWLGRCAIGILKSFSNIDCVNDRLRNRGFSFTAHYVGVKTVLWCFESELEKAGFIQNSFFWKDCFVSMGNWSDSPASNLRMVWISCTGIPLCYWSKEFFLKMGWMLGEPLMVDEDTVQRRRLDKGRILILVQQEASVTTNIRVEVGNGFFMVATKEESIQVDHAWIENFLGLQSWIVKEEQLFQKSFGGRKEEEEKGLAGDSWKPDIQHREEANNTQEDTDWVEIGKQNRRARAGFLEGESRQQDKVKGKESWRPKVGKGSKRKDKGIIIIEKSQDQLENEGLTESFSSSDVERSIPILIIGRGSVQDQGHKRKETRKSVRSTSLGSPLKEYLDQIEKAFIVAQFRKGRDSHVTQIQEAEKDSKTGLGEEFSESFVKETRSYSVSQKSGEGWFESVSATEREEDMEEINKFTKAKEGRKTRQGKKKKGKKMRKVQYRGMEIVNGNEGNQEEEVRKIMEIGVQLGLDLKGKEAEIADFFRKREMEDATHGKVISGGRQEDQ
ncbi:hypothetical protein LWI29_036499 [Acer saccharum]|uniref:DUF4283 domain-containing protein n=1 Tax=Acer saccharum TaxID=4024 RepID=A0AA39W1B8_ACESA|nr:hypothetical protein LWI29_036499 [Acer saccharum]